MPWLRAGDASATYPKLMQIAGFRDADDRAVNEFHGWLMRCATQSAAHLTDGVIDPGTAYMLGGARTKTLLRWGVRTGLLTPVKINGIEHWQILNDPDFLHIRSKAEVEWDRQRQRDAGDTGLTVPVRRRDGDNCRYCGVLVQWRGKKSNRSGQLDHREPGQPATVDTYVVACTRCNTARKANPQWDDDHPLRPAPTRPNYSRWTAEFLTENGYPTQANVGPDATRSTDTATTRPEARTAPAEPTSSSDTAPRATAAPEVDPELDPNSHSHSGRTGSPGSGRSGSGGSSDPPTARRARRGKRGRGTSPPPDTCCEKPYPQPDPDRGGTTCLTCDHHTPPTSTPRETR